MIKIDFKNKPIDFWQAALFAKIRKIPIYVILIQAYEKGLLQDSKKKLLLEFIEYIKKFENNFTSQICQDLFALFIIGSNSNKTFLEFGATDGVEISNTYILENNFLWSGVLAEPDIYWTESLKKNRPKSKILTKCIWNKSNEKIKFFSSIEPSLSTIEKFKFSDSKSKPMQTERRVKEGKNIEVETISLNQLIEEEFSGIPPSYISIDTEGSEFEILKSFNFLEYGPTVFTIEHNFTEYQNMIDKLMLDNNYTRVFSRLTVFDAWYVSQKALDKLEALNKLE